MVYFEGSLFWRGTLTWVREIGVGGYDVRWLCCPLSRRGIMCASPPQCVAAYAYQYQKDDPRNGYVDV